jgi:hypothetical protein
LCDAAPQEAKEMAPAITEKSGFNGMMIHMGLCNISATA